MSTPSRAPARSDTEARTALRIYLHDHRAGAAAGLALARRSLRSNHDSDFGDVVTDLVGQLESDLLSLATVMEELSVRASRWKQCAALAGERVGRLKPNGHVVGYSNLGRLLELELLLAGIDAKRSLWRSLRVAPIELRRVDLEDLINRAGRQRARLEPYHREAARLAFHAVGAAAL